VRSFAALGFKYFCWLWHLEHFMSILSFLLLGSWGDGELGVDGRGLRV
jgi:hypothetical protein